MNREALEKTIRPARSICTSRSRGRVALKGESSGHFQLVKEVLTDCDKDTVIFKVEQNSAACHEGYYSCFYRQYEAKGSRLEGHRGEGLRPEHGLPQVASGNP